MTEEPRPQELAEAPLGALVSEARRGWFTGPEKDRFHSVLDELWSRAERADTLAAEVTRLTESLRRAMDESVARWHETCPNEERGLAEWLGLSQEEFMDFVMRGIAALSVGEPPPQDREGENGELGTVAPPGASGVGERVEDAPTTRQPRERPEGATPHQGSDG